MCLLVAHHVIYFGHEKGRETPALLGFSLLSEFFNRSVSLHISRSFIEKSLLSQRESIAVAPQI